MTRQKIILVIITGFLIAIAIGYAIYAETIDVIGTAVADGVFDIEFTSIGSVKSFGYTKEQTVPEHALAAISEDGNVTVINVNKLDFPGAYVEIPITIKNVGTLKAYLADINTTGLNESTSKIKISYLYEGKEYDNLPAVDKLIDVQGTKLIVVRVEWKEDATQDLDSNAQFTISLDYKQSV